MSVTAKVVFTNKDGKKLSQKEQKRQQSGGQVPQFNSDTQHLHNVASIINIQSTRKITPVDPLGRSLHERDKVINDTRKYRCGCPYQWDEEKEMWRSKPLGLCNSVSCNEYSCYYCHHPSFWKKNGHTFYYCIPCH